MLYMPNNQRSKMVFKYKYLEFDFFCFTRLAGFLVVKNIS